MSKRTTQSKKTESNTSVTVTVVRGDPIPPRPRRMTAYEKSVVDKILNAPEESVIQIATFAPVVTIPLPTPRPFTEAEERQMARLMQSPMAVLADPKIMGRKT